MEDDEKGRCRRKRDMEEEWRRIDEGGEIENKETMRRGCG